MVWRMLDDSPDTTDETAFCCEGLTGLAELSNVFAEIIAEAILLKKLHTISDVI